jgi:hypothetical protein
MIRYFHFDGTFGFALLYKGVARMGCFNATSVKIFIKKIEKNGRGMLV